MPNFQVPNLEYLRAKDPRLAEVFDSIQNALNNIATQTGAVPQGPASTPSAPSGLNVTAAQGIFDIAITDNEPSQSNIAPDYFLEYSTTQSFQQPTVIHLGPSRNWRGTLGNQTLYWRTYKQVGRGSQPSRPIYFGGPAQPVAVIGGGASSGPTPLPSQGSGTASTNGLQGGVGYGKLPVRNVGPVQVNSN